MSDDATSTYETGVGHMVADSKDIASRFGKRRSDVLRAIRDLQKKFPPGFNRANFEEQEYLDARGRSQPMFAMTEKGFFLLTNGFTGENAANVKLKLFNDSTGR